MTTGPTKLRFTRDPADLRQWCADQLEVKGWTVSRWATEYGVPSDRAAMGRYLRGEREPSASKLIGWITALGGSVAVRWDEIAE